MKLWLSVILVCVLCLSARAEETDTVGGWVIVQSVKVHTHPNKRAASRMTLHRGMLVAIGETRNGYYGINPDAHMRYGWIPARDVRKMTLAQTDDYLYTYWGKHHAGPSVFAHVRYRALNAVPVLDPSPPVPPVPDAAPAPTPPIVPTPPATPTPPDVSSPPAP